MPRRFNVLSPIVRRELTRIFTQMTFYDINSDREILEQRLRSIVSNPLPDAFYDMADSILDELKETRPSAIGEVRSLFYSILTQAKFQYRTPETTTSLMMIGLFMSSLFPSSAPKDDITAEEATGLAELLRKLYLNPNAKITVYPELMRNNQGPALDTETAGRFCRLLAAAPEGLYPERIEDYFPPASDDPVLSLESERDYGLYLRHIIIAITVPAGEPILVHPYRWCDIPRNENPEQHAGPAKNSMRGTPWAQQASQVLATKLQGFDAIVSEPFPVLRGVDFMEQTLAPYRMEPLITSAIHQLNCTPDDLFVSIAFFCSRPDAVKHFTNELRIAVSHKAAPYNPFAGDCIAMQESHPDNPQVLDQITLALEKLGITRIVTHEEARYFEVEDEGGRIYTNIEGIATLLTRPGMNGVPAVPEHLIN